MDTNKSVPGGLGPTLPATPKIQLIVDQVKSKLEEMTDEKYEIFKSLCYRQQVVAGMLYFVKVKVGEDDYSHLKIFEPPPQNKDPVQLLGYQTGHSKDDPLEYFNNTVYKAPS